MPISDITVDWGQKIINIPKTATTLVQLTPNEVRELDLNQFRLYIAEEQASVTGIAYETAINHTAPVTVGGVELARVVEVINNYTITFEDDQYSVNLVGANSNVADRVNANQVSIRSANSAGLVTSAAIEFSEYGGGVTVDVANGSVGAIYPIGTDRSPSNNFPDAKIIADQRGFKKYFIKGNITIGSGDDVSGRSVIGENPIRSVISVLDASQTQNSEIFNATVNGTLDGNTLLQECRLQNLEYVNGTCINCGFENATFRLGGNALVSFINCYSLVPGSGTPTFDMDGLTNSETPDFIVRNYNGGMLLRDFTGGGQASIDLNSGQVKIDPSCTNGILVIRGVGKVINAITGEDLTSGTYFGGLQLTNETEFGLQTREIWQRVGLDKANPLRNQSDGGYTTGNIDVNSTQVGDDIIQTRQ